MRLMSSLAGVSALALFAAETGSGSGSPPAAPTPEELQAAEVARVAAVEKLSEIRAETEKALAEAAQLVKDAQAAKTKAAEDKAAADRDSKAAKKSLEQAVADKAKADAAIEELYRTAEKRRDAEEALRVASEPAEVVEVPAYDGPRQAIVWAAPGHAMLAVGVLISVPAAEAEALRGAGRARFALDEEVAALGDQVPELAGL